MHCRKLSSIPGLHPVDASSTSLLHCGHPECRQALPDVPWGHNRAHLRGWHTHPGPLIRKVRAAGFRSWFLEPMGDYPALKGRGQRNTVLLSRTSPSRIHEGCVPTVDLPICLPGLKGTSAFSPTGLPEGPFPPPVDLPVFVSGGGPVCAVLPGGWTSLLPQRPPTACKSQCP